MTISLNNPIGGAVIGTQGTATVTIVDDITDASVVSYFLTTATTWQDAQQQAQVLGGNLVTINDPNENQFLVDAFGDVEDFWIGFNDATIEGQFEWVNGETASYNNWRNGEPNNSSNSDYGILNYLNPGLWGDQLGTESLRGIVEVFNAIPELSVDDVQVIEGNPDAVALFTVTLSGATNQTVTVNYTTNSGDAIANSDFTPISGTLNFNPTESVKTIAVPILKNDQGEALETFTLTLDTPVNATISDDLATASIIDGTPVYYLTDLLTWTDAQAAAQGLGGNLVTINSAVENQFLVDAFGNTEDFWIGFNDETNEGQFEWVNGETISYTNWNSGQPNNSGGDEHYAHLNFSGGRWNDQDNESYRGIVEVVNGQSTIYIEDLSIVEDGNSEVNVSVTLNGITHETFTVDYSISPDTATENVDYTPTATTGTITFNPGESFKNITIPITDDNLVEGNESFNVILSNPQNTNPNSVLTPVLGQNTATVTLVEETPIINFTETEYKVNEDGTPVIAVTLNRSGSIDLAVTVDVNLSDGRATSPDDYDDTTINVSFASAETTKVISIPIVDDLIFEDDENLTLSLNNVSGNAQIGAENQAKLTIFDNEINRGYTLTNGNNAVIIDNSHLNSANIGASEFTLTDLPDNGTLSLSNSQALSFDGNDDYLSIGNFNNFPTTEFTIEGWFQKNDFNADDPLISYAVSDQFNEILIQKEEAEGNTIDIYLKGVEYQTGVVIPDQDWHHWAFSWGSSDGQLKVYLDAIEVYSGSAAQGETLISGGTLILGQEQDSLEGGFDSNQTYQGQIDDLRIWNTVRMQQEIQDNYQTTLTGTETGLVAYHNFDSITGNIATDVSGNGNDGTINGATQSYGILGDALSVNDTFTQEDIDNNRLVYTPNNSSGVQDNFKFTVTDGETTTLEQTFNIAHPVDLSNWTQQGVLSNGDWTVTGNQNQFVEQSINGNPTLFVSPFNFINGTVNGTIEVVNDNTNDDDFIGFVFGYQSPVAEVGDATSDYEFLLFDWKQDNQAGGGGTGFEGFALSRLELPTSPDLWAHLPSDGLEIIATDYDTTKGWLDNTEYEFTLTYTTDRILIKIDGETIFDVDGTFDPGRFGFYNYSQANVQYGNFRASGLFSESTIATPDNYSATEDDILTIATAQGLLNNDINPTLGTLTVYLKCQKRTPVKFFLKKNTY